MFEDWKTFFSYTFGGMMSPTQEGMQLIWYAIYAAIAGLLLRIFWTRGDMIGLLPLGILFALLFAFFFRNPERNTQFSPDEIACPADGRVMTVRSEGDPKVIVVRIFLSVFDVHIQRATIDGTIGQINYHKGKFAVASQPDAMDNERNRIEISNGDRFAHVEQITGAVARRIVCWVKPGQQVKAGERIGLIYFGSQVAIFLPADKVRVVVKPGQKVEGAVSVIGLWK
jgi:phosphatidylserine decarboxylase